MTNTILHFMNRDRAIFRPGLLLFFLCVAFIARLTARQSAEPVNWDAYRFLLGEWIGEGSGDPGQGSGGFAFALDLQNTVLVRKNYANYPATKDRPAFSHSDLMIVYREKGITRADYFDNEQHVIHYSVSISSDSTSFVFVSDPVASEPRYRLTNAKLGTDSIEITFEIAPPGKPDSFTRYIEAVARRKK
jgi:hypothetical protein